LSRGCAIPITGNVNIFNLPIRNKVLQRRLLARFLAISRRYHLWTQLSRITRFEGRSSSDLTLHLDADEYQTMIMRSGMLEQLDQKYGRFKWHFIQDGAPPRGALKTSDLLAECCLILPGWPPNSPDLKRLKCSREL
jgi:hypothetical protein